MQTRFTSLTALLAAVCALTLGLAALAPQPAEAALGDIVGSLPTNGGVALAVWGGGSTSTLQSAVTAKGCTLQGVWYLDQSSQVFVTFVPGAPSVVNSAWNAKFTSDIAANTPLIVSCRGAAPVAPPPPAAAKGQSQAERDFSAMLVTGINAERAKRGLAAFSGSTILQTTAEKYAVLQAAAGTTLSHEIDGTEPWDRARAQGYPSFNIGEVIAARTFTGAWSPATEAPKFVQMWMDSPPHRSIIMTEDPKFQFTEIGVGCVIETGGGVGIYCIGVTGKP
jgi:uncharacterized protein YkwD